MSYNYIERLRAVKETLSELRQITKPKYSRVAALAAAFVFNNLFEECWKLMNELLIAVYGYSHDDRTIKGPAKTLAVSFEVGLIDSPRWKKMMIDRNNTTHDYRNQNIEYFFNAIKTEYIGLIDSFVKKAEEEIGKLEIDGE